MILNFNDWNMNEQKESFKVYYLSNRPKYKYRRSGDRWQFQEKETTRKDIWHWVTNEDSIKALKAQYEANKKKASAGAARGVGAAGKAENYIPKPTNPDAYWTLITIIACENYADNKQGMADTAQSIYNRYNVQGQPYGKTIKEVILAKNQYQPVTIGKSKGAAWDSINSKDKAISVYMTTKGLDKEKATVAINNAIAAQKDSKMIANAKSHVGSRTEFLASAPSSKSAVGVVERSPAGTNNSFFWSYAGKTHYYDEKILAATAQPDTVRVA